MMDSVNRKGNNEKEMLALVRERSLANPFPKHCHVVLAELKRDYAEMYVDLTPELTNYAGAAHGGLLFTMADFCASTCARTDGRKYVTLDAEAHYLKNVKTGRLTAKSKLIHRGRTSVLVDVEICSEEEVLLFTSRITLFCVGEYT